MRRLMFALCCLWLALLSPVLRADSVEQINDSSARALQRLQDYAPGVDELLRDAAAVLVFPDVVKLGFGVGGQYGEGALLIEGEPAAYYATAGASFGLQLGAQTKSEVIVFMTEQALADFRDSRGWEVGVDGGIALGQLGAGGRIDSDSFDQPVVGFIFSNQGLMGNLTFEGAKITRIAR
jgi:lipid-binding SYLF domain-containing protein